MTIHRKNKISTYSYMSNSEWIKIRDDFYDTDPPFDSTVRKELFREVYIFLQELNINVWITGGTLLGAVRDNNFIEWDDDIDLDLLESVFLLNMYNIREGLIQLGYIVRLIDNTEYPKMVVYKNSMKIAIGSLKKSGDMLLRPCYKLPVKFFKRNKTIGFMGLKVLVPHPPEEYLTYVYGRDWKYPKHVEDDTQLYTIKYLRRSSIRVVLKRFYLIVKKFFQ